MAAIYASVDHKGRTVRVCLGDMARWFGIKAVSAWVKGRARLLLKKVEFKHHEGSAVCDVCGRKVGAPTKVRKAKAIRKPAKQKRPGKVAAPSAPVAAAQSFERFARGAKAAKAAAVEAAPVARDKSWREMTKRERAAYSAALVSKKRAPRAKLKRGRYAGRARREAAEKYQSRRGAEQAAAVAGARGEYFNRVREASRAKREREIYDAWASGEFERDNYARYQEHAVLMSDRELRAWYQALPWSSQIVPPGLRQFKLDGADYWEASIMDPDDRLLDYGDAWEGPVRAPAAVEKEFDVPF